MAAHPATVERPAPRRRNVARVLVVVAALLAFLAIFAIWVDRQLLSTDAWTRSSSEMLDSPVIRAELANFMADQLYANVDVEGELRDALPDRAQALAAPAAGALRSQVEAAAREALSRPRVQELWEDANRLAHERLLAVIDGRATRFSSSEGGEVVIDLEALLQAAQERAGVGARAADALPADAAQIVVLRSDELDLGQKVGRTLERLPVVLVTLSLALFGLALAVAPGWRRRTVRSYGIGLAVAGAGALTAEAWAGDAVVGSLAETSTLEPVVRTVWGIYTPLLDQAATAAIGYGLVMVVGAWLAGPSRWAVATRRALAPYLREPLIAYGAFAVIVAAVVLWWAPTPAMRNPVTALILVALLALGFEGLRRLTAREFPDAVVRQAEPLGAASEDDRLEQLERLRELRTSGVLDEAEFRAEKERILAGNGNAQPAAPLA